MPGKSPHVVFSQGPVTRALRERRNRHPARAFWLTGLSGAGKSTLAHLAEARLHELGVHSYTLDGDNVRCGLCGDLGFSPEDRAENLRRVGETVRLFLDAGIVCLAAFISPLEKDRRRVKALVGERDFFEIFVKCPLEVCEGRDVKGLYARARAGELRNYTGISSPYEEPQAPDLVIETALHSVEESVSMLTGFVLDKLGRRLPVY